jgi:tetratricopeptide (TPR) repeat protein
LGDNGGVAMRLLILGAFLLVAALGAAPALAADDDASAQARQHYQKANSYYDLGRYQEAITEYEAAYQLKNDPAFLYNLAQSNRLAGNAEQALRFYKTYLRKAPKGPFKTETEGFIAQLEQLLAQKNATQTSPPSTTLPPSGTTTPPATTEPPLTTTPPPPANEPVTPQLGPPPATVPVPVPTPNPPSLVGSPPPPSYNDHHQMIRAGEITAAAGGVVFLIGAAYGAAAVGAANQVNDQAKAGQAFDPSIEQHGKNAQKAEAVLMTVGALGVVTGGVLFFYGRHLAWQERATLMPIASSNGAGASLRVTF